MARPKTTEHALKGILLQFNGSGLCEEGHRVERMQETPSNHCVVFNQGNRIEHQHLNSHVSSSTALARWSYANEQTNQSSMLYLEAK